MERVHGISITNIEQLKLQNYDLDQLAKQLIEVFFTQVFRDCFFHADMHPGNIWAAQLPNPSNAHPSISCELSKIPWGRKIR